VRENSEKSVASPRLCAHDAQQALELEIAMGFKTILVPIEQHDLMNSTLETALLLARKFDSYIEGFALRVAIPAAFAAGDVGAVPIPAFEQEIAENEKRSRSLFENFMQEHGVPCGGDTKALLSAWLENSPEGDHFVGKPDRVFGDTEDDGERRGYRLGRKRRNTGARETATRRRTSKHHSAIPSSLQSVTAKSGKG
jgi:hypothetical protein